MNIFTISLHIDTIFCSFFYFSFNILFVFNLYNGIFIFILNSVFNPSQLSWLICIVLLFRIHFSIVQAIDVVHRTIEKSLFSQPQNHSWHFIALFKLYIDSHGCKVFSFLLFFFGSWVLNWLNSIVWFLFFICNFSIKYFFVTKKDRCSIKFSSNISNLSIKKYSISIVKYWYYNFFFIQ